MGIGPEARAGMISSLSDERDTTDMDQPRIAFAGDRAVAVEALEHLLDTGIRPVALLMPPPGRASHDGELLDRCSRELRPAVLRGGEFREAPGLELLASLGPDFLVSVHFPYLVPPSVLGLPRRGCLNLHPAYLPFNRGWHTATWAILDGTPLGATLHYMDEGIDTGAIVHQERLEVEPGDTAATLYPRLFALEVEVFKEGWRRVVEEGSKGSPQTGLGTAHGRDDLRRSGVQRVELDEPTPPRALLRRLRGLSTSRVEEAAYFEETGRRFRVQVIITDDGPERG